MRLQPKKSDRPRGFLLVAAVLAFSLLYWSYLAITTCMQIVLDAQSYEYLGHLLTTQGWISYFTTGPNREPLYPLMIAGAMKLSTFTGFAYVKIMACLGVITLFLTQILIYKILRQFNVRQGICALVLAYMAVSPALNNAAFSLFSEIAALPTIVGIILVSLRAWEAVGHNKQRAAFFYGALLGVLLMLATFVKAPFECITPIYLIIFFFAALLKHKKMVSLGLCVLSAAILFYVPVTGYKWLNQKYNGNFAITNRGSWALYGSTARRMEPLTLKRFAEALAFVPGEGVCNSIFGQKECEFWSFAISDGFGYGKLRELNGQGLPSGTINSVLLKLSAQKALQNPFQYVLLTFVEGLKMFFWESTKIGYVDYPSWLQKIYNIKLLNNALRLLIAVVSFLGFLSIWSHSFKPQKFPAGFFVGLLIGLYILFFSFFFILTRYAFPIAPLFLVSIGVWLDQNLAPKKSN
jgi:hypothetical protein